jgi:uncharacterized protein YndB with AHSA1/START domain
MTTNAAVQKFGELQVTTPSDRELAMIRVFNAPRDLVFDAWTKPELLKRWLNGPDGWQLAVCEIDLKVGGAFRFEWHHREGKSMGFTGTYREIAKPRRLVFTENWFDDWTGGETLVTVALDEHQGKTTMTQTVLYSSRDARDGAIKTGMAKGAAQSYDALAELLERSQKSKS